jgi:hypothetical protein
MHFLKTAPFCLFVVYLIMFFQPPHVTWLVALNQMVRYVGFEVLNAVVMNSTIFWDITICSPLSINRRFVGTYSLHIQGQKNRLSGKPPWKHVASRWSRMWEKMLEEAIVTYLNVIPLTVREIIWIITPHLCLNLSVVLSIFDTHRSEVCCIPHLQRISCRYSGRVV